MTRHSGGPAASTDQGALRRGLMLGAAGLVAATGLALVRGDSLHDALILAGLGGGGATLAALVGWWALTPLRRQSVRRQAVAVALVVAVAMAAGVLLAAQAMFISGHDLNALLVVLLAAGSAGAAAGLRLGAQIDDDSRSVGELARVLGSEGPAPPSTTNAERLPPTQELARLATEITEVSAQLDEARRRERALEQSRRELIAWISHDLRGPLTSIRAMAEAMEDGVVTDGPTIDRYHTSTRVETERLAALVDDLFELSRITAGVTAPVTHKVPLTGIVDEAVDTVAARAESAGIRFERRYSELPALEVSVPELRRVLHNLFDNAIRHTRPGGEVVIEGHAEAGGAVLTVTDECGGIPAADLDRVFDLAFRGDQARGRDGGGGLGLTIAKGLVEACHGTLMVDNRTAGCRFTIHLPATADR